MSGVAGGGLDPGDGPAWRREIERLCMDDAYLAQLRGRARAYRAAPADGLPRALLDATGLMPGRPAEVAEWSGHQEAAVPWP